MTNFQKEKNIVRKFQAELDAPNARINDVLKRHTNSSYLWRGFHPFNELRGASEVTETFWHPLRTALTSLQRREDIFFAGHNYIDDARTNWVVSMGHLMGLFDQSFLNIPPTGKMIFLRYCEFHRIEDGKIVETAMYFDIPHFARQAGIQFFPLQTAAHLVQPGPLTHDGLLYESQPKEAGELTLSTINAMISDLGQWDNELSLEDELRQTWHEDMIWWGPEGIGATYTIPRYAKQHSSPFRAGFTDRSPTTHIARLAEGNYGGFFGWPNFTARPTGGFMGMPETNKPGEFRVIDIYRRSDNKLAENWVFIDLLHFWKCQGLDILKQLQDTNYKE
ncbi:ester cyclase [Kiloniella majae]|uniref:ester cyclase n=1 Tax=Kiloniella majae TaxID=1938558 RepID=UPI000A2796FB|nr:ester cyclase [Kiloniella majae]